MEDPPVSAHTYPSKAVLDRAQEAEQRVWDVMGALDDEELALVRKAIRVERALDDEPAGDSLAALARMR